MNHLPLVIVLTFLCYTSAHQIPRNESGRIKRNGSAIREFRTANPCPSTGSIKGRCPDYVVDHVLPLKRGGCDEPHNMQWQTKEEAREKDKWE